jgi:hypothetical protein
MNPVIEGKVTADVPGGLTRPFLESVVRGAVGLPA